MAWSTSTLQFGCGHGADAHAAHRLVLQSLQGIEQRLERTRRQRALGPLVLVGLERRQPIGLEHALGLVAEQHRVAVEGDAHFIRVRAGGARRMRIDPCCRYARPER
jgi:hypothetical protein